MILTMKPWQGLAALLQWVQNPREPMPSSDLACVPASCTAVHRAVPSFSILDNWNGMCWTWAAAEGLFGSDTRSVCCPARQVLGGLFRAVTVGVMPSVHGVCARHSWYGMFTLYDAPVCSQQLSVVESGM